jgi:hypothetical protein
MIIQWRKSYISLDLDGMLTTSFVLDEAATFRAVESVDGGMLLKTWHGKYMGVDFHARTYFDRTV